MVRLVTKSRGDNCDSEVNGWLRSTGGLMPVVQSLSLVFRMRVTYMFWRPR
jgi:hypothetical protein